MFGAHISRYHASGVRPSIAAHIEAAQREAQDEASFRLAAVAIFVGGPKNRKITLSPAERRGLRDYVARTGLCVIAHSTYSASPWGGDPDAARFIREELRVCREAAVVGLVVHLPKLPAAAVLRYLARLYEPAAAGVCVFLETPAVRPGESFYETPEKLAALFSAIRGALDPGLDHFGLCIDTAHLSVCGVDLRSREAAAAWLQQLEAVAAVIPPGRIMLHLNDSLRPIGVGPDAHAPLAMGHIWGGYRGRLAASGLAAFVEYANRHRTPVILERKPKEALKGDYLVLLRLGANGAGAEEAGANGARTPGPDEDGPARAKPALLSAAPAAAEP